MQPYHDDGQARFYLGDVRAVLCELEPESVQAVVTSPPYWGLRDYGVPGQLGLEPTPEQYVEGMVGVFREVRRVLRDDGTLWLNIGDTYAAQRSYQVPDSKYERMRDNRGAMPLPAGCKPKDLVGIPWMLAFALRADGWYLRSDIIWSKPNPMPESVTDRPTKAHEYLFLLSKRERYYYDADALRERPMRPEWMYETRTTPGNPDRNDGGSVTRRPLTRPAGWATGKDHTAIGWATEQNQGRADKQRGHSRRHAGLNDRWDAMEKAGQQANGRNKRTVWTIATEPYPEAHFATFPTDLVEPCILAGSREGDTVLDPFLGSGTTAYVAKRFWRRAIGIDLSAAYLDLAVKRCAQMGLIPTEAVS